MQPISQSISPLLGYASPVEQPYQEEAAPLGLLAFVAKQQEDAERQQVAQSPLFSALGGIGGANDGLATGMRSAGGGKLGEILKFYNGTGEENIELGPNEIIARDIPVPEGVRLLLEQSDVSRLREMDARQKFEHFNAYNPE